MKKLLIDEEKVEDVVVLKLQGLVDSGTSQLMEGRLNDLISDGNVKIVVDLDLVDYISSAGWGIFVGEIKGVMDTSTGMVVTKYKEDRKLVTF